MCLEVKVIRNWAINCIHICRILGFQYQNSLLMHDFECQNAISIFVFRYPNCHCFSCYMYYGQKSSFSHQECCRISGSQYQNSLLKHDFECQNTIAIFVFKLIYNIWIDTVFHVISVKNLLWHSERFRISRSHCQNSLLMHNFEYQNTISIFAFRFSIF